LREVTGDFPAEPSRWDVARKGTLECGLSHRKTKGERSLRFSRTKDALIKAGSADKDCDEVTAPSGAVPLARRQVPSNAESSGLR